MVRPLPKQTGINFSGGDPMIGGHARIDEPLASFSNPKPLKFPMKFKEFLRRAFGGRLYADRLRFFRRFLDSEYNYGADEPAKLLEFFIKSGIQNETAFNGFSTQITQWRTANKIQQRRDAAKKSWQPKIRLKRKKSFDRHKRKAK